MQLSAKTFHESVIQVEQIEGVMGIIPFKIYFDTIMVHLIQQFGEDNIKNNCVF